MSEKNFDVYSYGMISTSTLYLLQGHFPDADAYAEIKNSFAMTGGEAANSSIVLSKLGVKVKLDGNWIGNNEKSLKTLSILKDFDVDTESITIKDNYNSVEEVVIADSNTRTIFATYGGLFSGERQWNIPKKEDIEAATLVCLDPFFNEQSQLVAKLCRQLDKPYITVDCLYTNEIASNADVLIVSGEFRKSQFKDIDKEELFGRYLEQAKGLVIFTSGDDDIIYGKKGEEIKKFTPCKIQPIDTAGAGDSFRSGIIYGLLNKWSVKKTIGFASVLAAYICESFPGVLKCPSYDELLRYATLKAFEIN